MTDLLASVEPMLYWRGWSYDAPDGTLFQLWSPKPDQVHWAAAWTTDSDCNFDIADSPGSVLDSTFKTHPDFAMAVIAASALLAAAQGGTSKC